MWSECWHIDWKEVVGKAYTICHDYFHIRLDPYRTSTCCNYIFSIACEGSHRSFRFLHCISDIFWRLILLETCCMPLFAHYNCLHAMAFGNWSKLPDYSKCTAFFFSYLFFQSLSRIQHSDTRSDLDHYLSFSTISVSSTFNITHRPDSVLKDLHWWNQHHRDTWSL